MKKLLLIVFAALALVGCGENEQAMPYETPVSGHWYANNSEELHFDSKYNKVLLIENTAAGTSVKTNQFYLMDGDTISTYNNTTYTDYRRKFIYCGSFLKSYHGDNYILEETK